MVLVLPNLYKFVLNSVDITSHVYRLENLRNENKQLVSQGTLKIKKSVDAILTVNSDIIGDDITIQRGKVVNTERYIFRGEVIKFIDKGSFYELTIACKGYRATKRDYDYTFDINIDTEAGVGSEIVKTLFDILSISYDASSVISTGTDAAFKIITYPAKGKISSSLKDLADIYLYQIFYDSEDDLGYFIPTGYTSTSTILSIGTDIPQRITWETTGEDLANNITLIGGTQLDWNTETFNGDASTTEFTLAAKPVDTKVTVDGTQLNRGVNSTDPNDFYIESDAKKVIFTTPPSSDTGNVIIEYSYNVPVKVTNSDYTSITKYTQRDLTIVNEKLTNSDDAEMRAKTLIDDNADVMVSAPFKVLGNNDLKVGQIITINDTIQSTNKQVVVRTITYGYPYIGDVIQVGDIPSDDLDLVLKISDNIDKLKRQLASDSDISVQLINNNREVSVVGYAKVESASPFDDTLYWESPIQGTWNDFNWAGTTEETYSVVSLHPINNIVYEDFYSSEFKDSVNTDATWTTGGTAAFTSGQIAQSVYYYKDLDETVTKATLVANYTGTLTLYLSADGTNWKEVTSGVQHTFTNTGNYLYWKAEETGGSTAELNSIKVTING